jgi:hypothetical protein
LTYSFYFSKANEQLLARNPDFMMDELGTAVFLSRAALYGKSTFSTPFCWQENEVTCYQGK